MHSIWWDIALRDVLGPIGYLALIVLIMALLHLAGTGKPREELGQLFVLLGASTAALSDLIYLSHITWWRAGGFQTTPDIIAHGRAFEVVDNAGRYLQLAGYLILALGITCLAPTLREAPLKSRRLSLLAYCQAASDLGLCRHSRRRRRWRRKHCSPNQRLDTRAYLRDPAGALSSRLRKNRSPA